MFLNFLRYGVKLSFYYIKIRFIKALNVYSTAVYQINAKMAIKKSINLFIIDFIELINSETENQRVSNLVNAK